MRCWYKDLGFMEVGCHLRASEGKALSLRLLGEDVKKTGLGGKEEADSSSLSVSHVTSTWSMLHLAKASLLYRSSSSTTRATWRNPVWKKNISKRTMYIRPLLKPGEQPNFSNSHHIHGDKPHASVFTGCLKKQIIFFLERSCIAHGLFEI